MHEVYWARFARQQDGCILLGTERLGAPAAVDLLSGRQRIAAGSGFAAYPQLAQAWDEHQSAEQGDVLLPLACAPRARDIARLAAIDGLGAAVPPERALPVYLRDDVASPPASQAL